MAWNQPDDVLTYEVKPELRKGQKGPVVSRDIASEEAQTYSPPAPLFETADVLKVRMILTRTGPYTEEKPSRWQSFWRSVRARCSL